jgi:hypothetical protein
MPTNPNHAIKYLGLFNTLDEAAAATVKKIECDDVVHFHTDEGASKESWTAWAECKRHRGNTLIRRIFIRRKATTEEE